MENALHADSVRDVHVAAGGASRVAVISLFTLVYR
jgi:hypothetical protein